MQTHKSFHFRFALAFVGVLATAAVSGAQTVIPIDDFEDGNDDGWTRFDLHAGEPWGPGIWDASSKAYNIKSSGAVARNSVGTIFSAWDASDHPIFANGYVRARVTANSSSLPFLVMRATMPLDIEEVDTWSYYLLGAREDLGNFVVERVEGGEYLVDRFSVAFDFNRGEDWFFEFGTVGGQITAKVWPVSAPEPPSPQWTYTDPDPVSGTGISVGSWLSMGLPPDVIDVTFDDIVFTVPEPTSVMLLLVGIGIACLRDRRLVMPEM